MFALESCKTILREKSKWVGRVGGTSSIDEEDHLKMVGKGETWDQAVILTTWILEKFTVLGRRVSLSAPMGVSGLQLCNPNILVPLRWGLQVESFSPSGMLRTFWSTARSPVCWVRCWAHWNLSSSLLGQSPPIPPFKNWWYATN